MEVTLTDKLRMEKTSWSCLDQHEGKKATLSCRVYQKSMAPVLCDQWLDTLIEPGASFD